MRQFLLRTLLCLIEKDISKEKTPVLTDQQKLGLMSQLWENPGFRDWVNERNSKLMYSMVGAPGSAREPRDRFIQLQGQRIEILELAARAKRSHEYLLGKSKSK